MRKRDAVALVWGRIRCVAHGVTSHSSGAVNQTAHVHADAEGHGIQIEMNTVGEAQPDIEHRHSGVYSKIESIVAGEVRAARGLLIQFVDTAVTA